MRSYRTVFAALVGFFLALPFGAAAQERHVPTSAHQSMPTPSIRQMRGAPNLEENHIPPFGKLDANEDQQLSRGEIPKDVEELKTLRSHFQEADKDHNGRLSPLEYNSYLASRALSPEGS